MARKIRAKVPAMQVPQSLEEAAELVRELGACEREIAAANKALNDQVAALQAAAVVESQPHLDRRSQLLRAIAAFAEANRQALTGGGKTKTVKLPGGGELGWRFTPPKVTVSKAEDAIAWMKAHRMRRFIRTKPEVNREALLADPKAAARIPGVSISRTEELWVRPLDLVIDVTAKTRKVGLD